MRCNRFESNGARPPSCAALPTTLEGIERYLGSGLIKGIGPVYARKLVRAFGENVFDVVEQAPGRPPRAVQRRDMPWAKAESARIVRSAKRIAAQGRNPIRLAPFRPRARRW